MSENINHNSQSFFDRISIVGNACGGKTWLSFQLGKKYHLPVVHIDSIQFDSDLNIKPYHETVKELDHICLQDKWIIDGYGPLDNLEARLTKSQFIVMIDLPIWVHYWWALKRTAHLIFIKKRPEMPEYSNERQFQHTIKLFKTIQQIHLKMRPEMLRILSREKYKNKTLIIKNTNQLNTVYKNDLVLKLANIER